MSGRRPAGEKARPVASVEISESDLRLVSASVLVARLVAGGVSRLTAERFVELRQSDAESGRARPHATSRR
jgi:hypothetical protein